MTYLAHIVRYHIGTPLRVHLASAQCSSLKAARATAKQMADACYARVDIEETKTGKPVASVDARRRKKAM